MAGIGKYKKGAKFTLKSGNKPAFRVMGSSPANLNNFGIGPGGSPWKQETDDDATDGATDGATASGDKSSGENTKNTTKEQGGDAEAADKAWVKALKAGTTLLSGGIQGVYGGAREYPKINYGKKAEEATITPGQKILNQLEAGDAGTYEEYMAKNPDSEYSKEEWTKLNLQNVIGGTEKNENDDE